MSDPTKSTVVIASVDPAIDTERMTEERMLDYMRTRDVSKLSIKTGKNPTRFHVRPITQAQMLFHVMHGTSHEDRCVRAFASSVERVDGAWIDGRECTWAPADTRERMTAAELENFSLAEILDVGSVAWTRSFLGQRIALRCVPLPWLLGHLAALPYLSAEQSIADLSSQPVSATAASQDHGATDRAASSASPTVAAATVEVSQPGA
jgi:hypothetical protein